MGHRERAKFRVSRRSRGRSLRNDRASRVGARAGRPRRAIDGAVAGRAVSDAAGVEGAAFDGAVSAGAAGDGLRRALLPGADHADAAVALGAFTDVTVQPAVARDAAARSAVVDVAARSVTREAAAAPAIGQVATRAVAAGHGAAATAAVDGALGARAGARVGTAAAGAGRDAP